MLALLYLCLVKIQNIQTQLLMFAETKLMNEGLRVLLLLQKKLPLFYCHRLLRDLMQ